jgi:ADP-ribose pyrophosphatase YjhB (NUDIX family)
MRLLKSRPVQTLIVQTWGRAPFPAWLRRVIQWTISPKFLIGVVALVFDAEGRLLLLRHTYKRRYPWGFPGGGLGYGETTEEAVRRELREEAGVEGTVVRLLGIRTDQARRLIDVFYLCKATHQDFQPNPEVSTFAYFPLDALPERVSPYLREMIARFAADGRLPAAASPARKSNDDI